MTGLLRPLLQEVADLAATQVVSRVRRLADNSEVEETSVYLPASIGKAPDYAPKMQLSEQWLIERKPGPGNTTIESTSIAKPTFDIPPRMSSYQKISEAVCSGSCKPEDQ